MALLALCASLPYANTLLNGFVYDDSYQVLDNRYIRSFHYLRQVFTTSVWSFRDLQARTNYYRPLMTFGYLVCYKLFGLAPFGFHLANLLLHVLIVLLLFHITVTMFRDRALAFGAATLFALHPIHTESVAWVGAVADLEVTFFFLLTFWFFLHVGTSEGGRSEPSHIAMVVSFALALLSKEQALTLPLLATIYEHFYRADGAETTFRQKAFRYRALWMSSVAYVLLRIHYMGAFAPVSRFPNLSVYQVLLSAFSLIGQYAQKLVWPVRLCAFYVFRKSSSLLDPGFLGGVGVLVFFAVVFKFLWRRDRTSSFGLVWLLVTLLPVLNAQWVGLNVFAERYLYLPSVGLCWVAAWSVERLWIIASRNRPFFTKSLATVLASLAILCMVRIVTRNRDWRDDLVLCSRTLAASPDAYPMLMNLGTVYAKEGHFDAAETAWLEVLKKSPGNIPTLNNLGNLHLMQGHIWEAIDSYRQAVQASPKNGRSHLNLGYAYSLVGLAESAELQFRAGVALSPGDPQGYAGLGVVYCLEKDPRRAELNFREALSLSPSDSRIHLLLARCYAGTGLAREAAAEYRAVVAIDPGNGTAVEGLLGLEVGSAERKQSTEPGAATPGEHCCSALSEANRP